jgi:hypothetical protein
MLVIKVIFFVFFTEFLFENFDFVANSEWKVSAGGHLKTTKQCRIIKPLVWKRVHRNTFLYFLSSKPPASRSQEVH